MAEWSVVVHGATGYTGAETLRWVLQHPNLRLVGATSRQAAGRRLDSVWPALVGRSTLVITAEAPPADVHFMCLPHGEASRVAPQLTGYIVDLSGDHRLPEPTHSAAYRFTRSTAPWLYGLPELGHERYEGVTRVANPGCFASALLLALLPSVGQLPAVVHATGLTGSTGSGATPSAGTHHPSRAENVRPYKVLAHQHVPEVVAALGGAVDLAFVPISAPIRRGILVSVPIPGATLEQYQAFYHGNLLVRVLGEPPEIASVVGGPRADVGVVCRGDHSVVFCVIDNLGRGAGSQAVANLNLMLGLPILTGLCPTGPVV